MPASLYEQQLISACTADHPDHQYLHQLGGKPRLWTVWCSICEGKRYNDDDRHSRPNPDMSSEYVVAVEAAALLVCQEQARLSVLRRQNRKTRR